MTVEVIVCTAIAKVTLQNQIIQDNKLKYSDQWHNGELPQRLLWYKSSMLSMRHCYLEPC